MVVEVPSKLIPDKGHDPPSRAVRMRRDKNSKRLKFVKEEVSDLDVVAMRLLQEHNGDSLQVLSKQREFTRPSLRRGVAQGPRVPCDEAEDALGKPQEGESGQSDLPLNPSGSTIVRIERIHDTLLINLRSGDHSRIPLDSVRVLLLGRHHACTGMPINRHHASAFVKVDSFVRVSVFEP